MKWRGDEKEIIQNIVVSGQDQKSAHLVCGIDQNVKNYPNKTCQS